MHQPNELTRFPLCWPAGWKRTPPDARLSSSRFRVKFALARTELLHEVAMLQGVLDEEADLVISSNLRLRLDGLPRAGEPKVDDPGVAVYFRLDEPRRDLVVACDQYTEANANLRAIGLTIKAIRSIDRYGASDMLDRAFTGFTALPAAGESGRAPWWSILGWDEDPTGTDGSARVLGMAKAKYRALVVRAHPDQGGTPEQMADLQWAWKTAQEVLSP